MAIAAPCKGDASEFDSRQVLVQRHERFINRALELAGTSSHHKFKHAAIVAHNNTVLAMGTNEPRNRASIDYEHATVHAEVVALHGLSLGKRVTIYIARVNRFNEPMLSKPCSRCLKRIIDSGISEMVWSTSTGYEVARSR